MSCCQDNHEDAGWVVIRLTGAKNLARVVGPFNEAHARRAAETLNRINPDLYNFIPVQLTDPAEQLSNDIMSYPDHVYADAREARKSHQIMEAARKGDSAS